jgi:hypothetical protein
VPKAAWHRGGDSSVTHNPFGTQGSTPSYVCLPLAWCFASGDFNSPILVGLIWTARNLQEKMAKALAELKFSLLGSHIYGTKRL